MMEIITIFKGIHTNFIFPKNEERDEFWIGDKNLYAITSIILVLNMQCQFSF